MDFSAEMARRILTHLYTRQDGRLEEKPAFSPPEMGNDSDEMLRHVDRLEEIGWLKRTNDVRMKNHLDPVTLRPLRAARPWAEKAFDESAWEEVRAEVEALLRG